MVPHPRTKFLNALVSVGSRNAKNLRLFFRSSTTHYDDNKSNHPSNRPEFLASGSRLSRMSRKLLAIRDAAAETNWLTQSCQLRRIHSRTLNLKEIPPVCFPFRFPRRDGLNSGVPYANLNHLHWPIRLHRVATTVVELSRIHSYRYPAFGRSGARGLGHPCLYSGE